MEFRLIRESVEETVEKMNRKDAEAQRRCEDEVMKRVR